MRLIRLTLILFASILLSSVIFTYFLKTPSPSISINNHAFNIEIVKSSKEQEIGLGKYNKILQDFGMLFIFENKEKI